MAGKEDKWWEVNKHIGKATDAASEWFKKSIGLRDVLPQKRGGSQDIQSAQKAAKQVRRAKNPYGR